jgi:hypothetical protein
MKPTNSFPWSTEVGLIVASLFCIWFSICVWQKRKRLPWGSARRLEVLPLKTLTGVLPSGAIFLGLAILVPVSSGFQSSSVFVEVLSWFVGVLAGLFSLLSFALLLLIWLRDVPHFLIPPWRRV